MTYQEPESQRHVANFRQALADGDYMGMWRIMAGAFPTAPQPKTPAQAEIIMHRIRTETESLPARTRCYSDKWLHDKGYPSGLPELLKPMSARIYPRIADCVGIAVKMPALFKPMGLAKEIELSMSGAVSEVHADGVALDNRPVVHAKMFQAREKTIKTLLGPLSKPLKEYKG